MNTPSLVLTLLVLSSTFVLAGCAEGLLGQTSGGSDPQAIFSRMEEAIRSSNQQLFKDQWHPQGYLENLIGGSGLPGSRVFEQGARKRWYLKPDLTKVRTVEGVTIVPTDVWSWEQNRSVDQLDVALVPEGGRLLVLGAGEDPSQVDALARRFARKEPLAPAR